MIHAERALLLLLERIDTKNINEPLVGDLLEEFHSGRSRFWLLRQLFYAVLRLAAVEIVSNKLICLRGVVTGLLIVMPLTAVFGALAYFAWMDGPLQFWVLTCCAYMITGVALAYKFPSHRVAVITAFTLYALIAKISLVGFNEQRFLGSSDPVGDVVAAAATVLAPVCTVAGAFLVKPDTPNLANDR
jgi:hypothetical protein